jgi:hypothetical protein
MHRAILLLVLMFPGLARADPGCPILFKLGSPILVVARACSQQGGLLVRQDQRWFCRDRELRAATIFSFELERGTIKTVDFYPQAGIRSPDSGNSAWTLNGLLDAVSGCLLFEPEVLVVNPPDAGFNGLLFRWVLENGSTVTVQELNRSFHPLLIEVAPPP